MKSEGGFALLLSLLIILLLSVMILETNFQTHADLRAAGNFRDDLKAFYLARSAISAGEAILKDDRNNYDGLDELWAYPIPEYPLGDGTLSGSIVDEGGKFNLNSLIDTEGKSGDTLKAKRERLGRLFELLQVDPNLVDAIVDWIDKDSDPRPFGAEKETYQGLDPPYSIKDGPFETLAELHMVKGITDEIYWKVSPYLTVYGDPGKININTSDSLVIQSLDKRIDESMARCLIDKRPFVRLEDARTCLSDIYNDVFSTLGTQSKYFSLTAEGKVNNTRKVIHAVVDRQKRQLLYFRVE